MHVPHRHYTWFGLAPTSLITCSLVLVVGGSAAQAQSISFTNIADTTEMGFNGFDSGSGDPLINASGTVVFNAATATGKGIYTGNGGAIKTIATTTSGTFSTLNLGDDTPVINSSGVVAFYGETPGGVEGIYIGNGGAPTTIASGLASQNDYSDPVINDSGRVAFSNEIISGANAGQFGFYSGTGAGPLTTIIQTPNLQATGSTLAINNAGTVAFQGVIAGSNTDVNGVFTGSGGTPTTIAQDSTFGSNGSVRTFNPSINASGVVGFVAEFNALGGEGVYTGNGVTMTTIATDPTGATTYSDTAVNASGTVAFTASEFSPSLGNTEQVLRGNGTTLTTLDSFSNGGSVNDSLGINDAGVVAFAGEPSTGGVFIYAGIPGQVLETVLGTGSTLFGSTVTGLSLSDADNNVPGIINDNNQIVFDYTLLDGVSGVAVANLGGVASAPEPGALALLASAFPVAGGIAIRGRRNRRPA